jgi:hypothetical protein
MRDTLNSEARYRVEGIFLPGHNSPVNIADRNQSYNRRYIGLESSFSKVIRGKNPLLTCFIVSLKSATNE